MKPRLCSLVLLMVLSAAPAFGQGCVMCYTSAKGAATNGQKAITRGVITLLLPPIGLMLGLVGFAFYYNRNGHGQAEETAMMAPLSERKSAAGDSAREA
jgi:hypothetical protein